MHVVTVVDTIFASLMLLGGSYGIFQLHRLCKPDGAFPKELSLALLNNAWKGLFRFGWDSQYHLMMFWNLTCTAAIVHWNMVASGSVIAALYVGMATMLFLTKRKLLRSDVVVVV